MKTSPTSSGATFGALERRLDRDRAEARAQQARRASRGTRRWGCGRRRRCRRVGAGTFFGLRNLCATPKTGQRQARRPSRALDRPSATANPALVISGAPTRRTKSRNDSPSVRFSTKCRAMAATTFGVPPPGSGRRAGRRSRVRPASAADAQRIVRALDAVLALDHQARHADVGHVVLAARVRAARDLDVEEADLADHVVGLLARSLGGEVLADSRADFHALRDRQRAVVAARAGHDVRDVAGIRLGQADFVEAPGRAGRAGLPESNEERSSACWWSGPRRFRTSAAIVGEARS